ncbi:MAG: MFS transporter, partial [Turicibacter sp.]
TTNSVGSVAIMWFARAFLRIPIQYISGAVVDKYNKKYIVILANAISAPLAFSLIWVDSTNLYLAYTIVFLLQAINDIDVTAEVAMLPEIVDKDKLQEYNSLFSVLGTIALLLSPALGGLIFKVVGVIPLFIINAMTFMVATLSFLFIRYSNIVVERKNSKSSILKSGKEGFVVIKKNPTFMLLILSVMSLSILGRFYEIYKVYIADEILQIGTDGILYFSYAMAFGGFLTPIIIKKAKEKFEGDLVNPFIIFTVITSICYFIWGNAQSVSVSLITLFILGAISSCYLTLMTTIIQKNTPQELVGRVFAAYKIALISSAILGIVISPYVLKLIGLFGSFLIFSIIPIGIGGAILYLQRQCVKKR